MPLLYEHRQKLELRHEEAQWRSMVAFSMALDGLSICEISNVFGVSYERTRQIVARGIRMMKHPSRKFHPFYSAAGYEWKRGHLHPVSE